MTDCYQTDTICGYFLYINKKIERQGGPGYWKFEGHPFEVVQLLPTLSIDPWFIEYEKIIIIDGNILNGFSLVYLIGKNKTPSQLKPRVFEISCTNENLDGVLLVSNKTMSARNASIDEAIVSFKLNESDMKKSNLWQNISESEGNLSLCIRSDLMLSNNSDVSVSFFETKLLLSIDFLAEISSFTIDGIELEKKNAIILNEKSKLNVVSCTCREKEDSAYECVYNPIEQNSKLTLCLFPSNGMIVKKVENVILHQNGEEKFKAVENGDKETNLVSVSEGQIAVIEMIMSSSFFDAENPSPIFVTGNAVLEFKSYRRLNQVDDVNQHVEVKHAPFELAINIAPKFQVPMATYKDFNLQMTCRDFSVRAMILTHLICVIIGGIIVRVVWKFSVSRNPVVVFSALDTE